MVAAMMPRLQYFGHFDRADGFRMVGIAGLPSMIDVWLSLATSCPMRHLRVHTQQKKAALRRLFVWRQ